MQCKYLHKKKTGLFYFRRGIPEDLRVYYKGKRELLHSLQTRDEAIAVKRALSRAHIYDQEFDRLREGVSVTDEAGRVIMESGLQPKSMSEQQDDASKDRYDELMREIGETIETIVATKDGYQSSFDTSSLDPVLLRAQQILDGNAPLTLSDAMARRLKLVGNDVGKRQATKLHFHYFIDKLQEEDIGRISRERVERAIDTLLAEGKKTGTVKKYLSTVSSGVAELIDFKGSNQINPFRKVSIPNLGEDTESYHTFTPAELASICSAIRKHPDRVSSYLIGILVNTGCRANEIGGLTLENIHIDTPIPYIHIKVQPNRRLKTSRSKRLVPLVGISLEFAKRLVGTAEVGQIYAFPNWNKAGKVSRNNASATGNKAINKIVGVGTTHSFRHTIATRLINAGVNLSAVDDFLGWADKAMNKYYGRPEWLRISREHLKIMEEYEASSDEGYSGK